MGSVDDPEQVIASEVVEDASEHGSNESSDDGHPRKATDIFAGSRKKSAEGAQDVDTKGESKEKGDGEEIEAFDFGLKKKKKKSEKAAIVEGAIDGCGNLFLPGRVYPYRELLDRVQELIDSNNPTLSGSKKYTIKPPSLARVGSKKVAWTNFQEICKIMGRSPDHVLQFVLAELGTEGSVGGDGQLTLKGKFGPKHIESLLRKYITEYVTCSMCKSPNTTLKRDSSTRLFNIHCNACGASRSVTTIKSGFHATSRADRRKAKQAAV